MANKYLDAVVGPLLLVTLLLSSPVTAQEEHYEDPYGYRHLLEEAYNQTGIPWDQVLDDSVEALSTGIDFDCDTDIGLTGATNVNELTPADINVVAAMGDSITAAMGAKANTIFTALREYRGVSWSIGGDKDLSTVTTLPNIIRQYNPSVKGFSINYGDSKSSNARNNVAISGAIAAGMPAQARTLVDKIKADEDTFNNDWKLVTLWIGGNDLCRICKGNDDHKPKIWGNYIRDALGILKEMPRTFVNLVKILDVTKLAAVGEEGGLICDLVHLFACDCGRNKKNHEETIQAQKDYNEQLQNIVDDDEFHTDDFTVVLQPFMEAVDAPRKENGKIDMSYFAPDCFHFKDKGHRIAAVALWNNMVEPVGDKSTDWNVDPELKCPTEGAPYFYTKKNSAMLSSFVVGGVQEDSPSSHTVNLFAVLLGVGIATLVLCVVIVGSVVVAVWYKRRRAQARRRDLSSGTVACDTEKVYLIRKN